jgi:peptidase C39-like protein
LANIYVRLGIFWAVSAALFPLGMLLAKRLPAWALRIVEVAVFSALIIYVLLLHENIRMVQLLPLTDLPVWGNWLPPLTALLAGLAWRQSRRRVVRLGLTFALLAAVALSYGRSGLFSARPPSQDFWVRGVCRQSSLGSCSSCSAATLLRAHGIKTDEQEMVDLCLTSHQGTSLYGLIRGMRAKTAGTAWRVEAFRCSLDELRAMPKPVILLQIVLEPGADLDPRYEREWGWLPGVPHAVVLFGFLEDEQIEIGDPAVGRERWRVQALRDLWHGEGVRLVKRRD